MSPDATLYARCAKQIAKSSALIITAGAGMGVDSGLPDFRGPEGLWQAYPALREAGIRFEEIANPQAFARDPELAWGFYGHRLQRYRETHPHRGFAILKRIAEALPQGAFIYTSNVDGHFQKAGFAAATICEVHGSIHHLQCAEPCSDRVWPATRFQPVVDPASCRLHSPLPTCPNCGGLSRPNILMFGDWNWQAQRTVAQEARFMEWYGVVSRPLIIELGAGTTITTIRRMGDRIGAPLIRINPRESEVSGPDHLGVAEGALAGLEGIEAALAARGFFDG
jgi:NAD-dependent SIR2 family protein deacetylase